MAEEAVLGARGPHHHQVLTTNGARGGALPGADVAEDLLPHRPAVGGIEGDQVAFWVATNTLPWATATARLTMSQHSGV